MQETIQIKTMDPQEIKTPMRVDKKLLNLRAMGISNWCFDTHTKKKYSIQFYDYDLHGQKKIPRDDLLEILEIFPYDCLMYQTKQGIQFISFSILHGLNITKSRCLDLTLNLIEQDYWTEGKDLTLRVSAKWKPRRFRNYKTISNKPKFKGISKFPNRYTISKKHLEFYFKYMNLPLWVYNLYSDCIKKDYRIKNYHYKTRD